MRLIDADAAIEAINALREKHTEGKTLHDQLVCAGISETMRIIEQAKTIDAEPVVRCKNCRHSSRIASDISGRMRHCWSGRGRNNGDGFSRVNGDGYCDEGERMDADAPERVGEGQ